jgi:hypothetical protein
VNNHKTVKVHINDDQVAVKPGFYTPSEIRHLVDPPIPDGHEIWRDVDDGPDEQVIESEALEIDQRMRIYSSDDGASHPRTIPIRIDGCRVNAPAKGVTGAVLRSLTDEPIGPDRDLWRDINGSADERIDDDEVVTLRKNAEFYSVPRLITPGFSNVAE